MTDRRSWLLAAVLVALPACAGPVAQSPTSEPPPAPVPCEPGSWWAGTCGAADDDRLDVPRVDFARRLATIAPGDSAATVLERLGPPGDVQTELDPWSRVGNTGAVETWTYGTRGHVGMGTLGFVRLQADGTVQALGGNTGTALHDPTLPEPELRRLLRLLDSATDGGPLSLIRCVNALWSLGKARALAVISEYLRVVSEEDSRDCLGALLVLRLLFDVPAGEHHPRLDSLGLTTPEPRDPDVLPRFPLAVVEDIPVYLVVCCERFYSPPDPPEPYVEWYRAHGVLRARPLAPSAAPIDALERFARTTAPAVTRMENPQAKELVRETVFWQATEVLGTVARVEWTGEEDEDARWARLREAVHEPLTWEPGASRYTRLDGSSSPPAEPRRWLQERPRVAWRPGEGVELILARYDAGNLALQLRVSPARAAGRLRLTSASGETLLAVELGGEPPPFVYATTIVVGDRRSRSFRAQLHFAEGTTVEATLELEGKVLRSPPLRP